jgi:hypothetical protein
MNLRNAQCIGQSENFLNLARNEIINTKVVISQQLLATVNNL